MPCGPISHCGRFLRYGRNGNDTSRTVRRRCKSISIPDGTLKRLFGPAYFHRKIRVPATQVSGPVVWLVLGSQGPKDLVHGHDKATCLRHLALHKRRVAAAFIVADPLPGDTHTLDPAYWPVALFEISIFLIAGIAMLLGRVPARGTCFPLFTLSFIVLWGCFQLIAGFTIDRFATERATLQWMTWAAVYYIGVSTLKDESWASYCERVSCGLALQFRLKRFFRHFCLREKCSAYFLPATMIS